MQEIHGLYFALFRNSNSIWIYLQGHIDFLEEEKMYYQIILVQRVNTYSFYCILGSFATIYFYDSSKLAKLTLRVLRI